MPQTTKRCCTCTLEKPESEYSTAEWRKPSTKRCRVCIRQKNKAAVAAHPEKLAERNRKYYTENREELLETYRRRYADNRDRYGATQRSWREANRDHIRAYNSENKDDRSYKSWVARLRRVYSMTPDDYDRMLEEQGGVCAICGTDDPGKVGGPTASRRVFAVDHCHTSGNVRGLLCHRCNTGLGLFFDKPEALLAAAKYVTSHRKPPTTI